MIIEASKQVGLDFNCIIFTNLIEDKQRQTVIFKTKSLQLALPILRLNKLWIDQILEILHMPLNIEPRKIRTNKNGL